MTEVVFPVGRRVLILKDDVNTKTDWGFEFVKDDIDKEFHRQAYGVVQAVAPEAYQDVYKTKQCKPGDRVLFRTYAGTYASKTNDRLILVNDEDVLAIVTEQED